MTTDNQPLATRMRPRTLTEFVGQTHLLGEGKPLQQAIEKGTVHSMILWGPPGTGKTTLAQLLALHAKARFERLSAIMSGVKDIREMVKIAQSQPEPMILFLDEVHRFNKAQQDIFLPYIEEGTFILIGATTENPSFEINNALLSRLRVYVLKPLGENDLLRIIQQALNDKERGLGNLAIHFPIPLQKILVQACDGDSRQALNLLEIITDLAPIEGTLEVTEGLLRQVLQTSLRRFDRQGDYFYDQMSALHKAVRGSSPDAALYWYCRMLDGGCDPRYLARRVLRMASEDIGLADPRGLEVALHAAQTYERMGSPEGELAIAEAVVYLACAAKSNALYVAFNRAMQAVKEHGSLPVPLRLCNAPTRLMKELDYGKNYRYAHDEVDAYAAGENYFPDDLPRQTFYEPVNRGIETKIAEHLAHLAALDNKPKKRT